MAQSVKNLPAMQETWVLSLGQEEPPAKERATHSSILAWRIPWTEEPGGLQSMGVARVEHDLVTKPPPPPPKYIMFFHKVMTSKVLLFICFYFFLEQGKKREKYHVKFFSKIIFCRR